MKFFRNFIILALMSITALVLNSRAYAYGTYGLSCTNDAYGTQHGTNYVTAGNAAGQSGTVTVVEVVVLVLVVEVTSQTAPMEVNIFNFNQIIQYQRVSISKPVTRSIFKDYLS